MENSNLTFALNEIFSILCNEQMYDEVRIQCLLIENGGKMIEYKRFGFNSLKELLQATGRFCFKQKNNELNEEFIIPIEKNDENRNKMLDNNSPIMKFKGVFEDIDENNGNGLVKNNDLMSKAKDFKRTVSRTMSFGDDNRIKGESKEVYLNGVIGEFKVKVNLDKKGNFTY